MYTIRLLTNFSIVSAMAWCTCVGMPTLNAADDLKEHARAILASSADAIVTVRFVLKVKLSYSGQKQDQEQKGEINAVNIDPSGLFVTSAAQLDPTVRQPNAAALKKMNYSVDYEIKDLRILLADGTENAAEIVMTDIDLDIAFIRMKDKVDHLPAITFTDPAPAGLPLDDIFVLSRATKEANRTAVLNQGHIAGWVKGPQPYYLSDDEVSGHPGSLVYDSVGRLLGLEVFLPPSSDDGSSQYGMFPMARLQGQSTAIRPLAQVIELANQARTAKPTKSAAAP